MLKGRWPFELNCIEHAVCRSSAAKNTIASNGISNIDKTTVLSLKPRRAHTFFPEESMQRLAGGFASLACRLGRCSTFATGKQHPLTPAVCSATRQSEQSSVAVEGSAARTGDHGVGCLEHACCELNEPPRTNSPQGNLQARWFRTASCIGTSWRFAKEPRRFLCRFFVPLSSRRRKGNPLTSPGHRKNISGG